MSGHDDPSDADPAASSNSSLRPTGKHAETWLPPTQPRNRPDTTFRPARELYRKHGFADCAPFGDYAQDPNSVYMTLEL
ncbi:hypothetical protein [Actinopolyspora halophila]|uniref:hypothetical protein n=1 Tax=Actinopolyspora halophila TaxID=1850 RepID=UPI0012F927D9|nr:hypothetical protein [Actinopolyspora halophila]